METFKRAKLVALFFVLVGFSCDLSKDLQTELSTIKEKYVPDSRTELFRFELDHGILRGETTSPLIFNEVAELIREKYPKTIDSLYLLPHYQLGTDTLGIVNVSVANIRSEPRHSAELSTQALLGTPVRLLKKNGGWYLVQTPDHYLGYLESGVLTINKSWLDAPRKVFTSPAGIVKTGTTSSAAVLADLSFGNLLEVVSEAEEFTEVRLPDGRQGFVSSEKLSPITEFVQRERSIAASGARFLGVPYLWGGTSFKGVDCSGFTRTLFLDEGIYLPRDASQQALVGDPVPIDSSFSALTEGDLLFFGRDNEHISHVAVYLGNQRFIHSSGWVKFGSFDPGSDEYDEDNLKRLRFAKRVLTSANVEPLNSETFYNP